MAEIYCIIPHPLAYNRIKVTNSVIIRFNQAEESKYKILIIFGKSFIKPNPTQKLEWTVGLI